MDSPEVTGKQNIPPIKDSTRDLISRELQLEDHEVLKDALLSQMTRDILLRLKSANEPLTRKIADTLTRRLVSTLSKEPNSVRVNSYASGLSLVLKAYDLENEGLIENFGRLGAEENQRVLEIIENSIPENESNIFESVLDRPEIPDEAVYLNELIGKIEEERIPFIRLLRDEFKKGAVGGFQVLSEFWTKLQSSQQPPPQTS